MTKIPGESCKDPQNFKLELQTLKQFTSIEYLTKIDINTMIHTIPC